MSEESKEPKTAGATEDPENLSHPAAEIAELEDLGVSELFDESRRTPRLKELLDSDDVSSRHMTILAMTFAFFAFLCFTTLFIKYIQYRREHNRVAFIKKDPNHLDEIYNQSLGEFRVEWKDRELRADISVECSSKATCTQVKEKMVATRDKILTILQESNPDEILNPERKLLIRRRIVDQINEFNLDGKVLEANFTDLSVEKLTRQSHE